MNSVVFFTLSALLMLGGCGASRDVYTFSKANTSLNRYEADYGSCWKLAKQTKSPNTGGSGGLATVAIGSMASGVQSANLKIINRDNCMISKGYKKYNVSLAELRAFNKMNEAEKEIQWNEWQKKAR